MKRILLLLQVAITGTSHCITSVEKCYIARRLPDSSGNTHAPAWDCNEWPGQVLMDKPMLTAPQKKISIKYRYKKAPY